MFDIKWIRENPQVFDEGMKARSHGQSAAGLLKLDDARREHIAKLQDAQTRRNSASKEIGQAMAQGDTAKADALKAEVSEIKAFIQNGEEQERVLVSDLNNALAAIPNIPLEDVPVGKDEEDNVVYRIHGEMPAAKDGAKEHYELGETLGGMDFEGAALLSGSRFVVLKRDIARLERALGQFMLDLHTQEHGYTEISPPLLVRDEAVFGTGQLPKFSEDLFRTTDGRWLIPTAEVPLTNLVREQILDGDELPIRLTALTPCFRSEAGSAGRDTRGMLRQHQFQKVELVSITRPEHSLEELERMLDCAETVLKRLDIHFRTMTLCSGDMGFSARKTYDIEAWLPGQGAYREISSCSVCGDFQARRMGARYRLEDGKSVGYLHTLNGSGVATGRALIAVLENYQNPDGTVTVPDVLRPYMNGLEKIEKADTV
ncbi:MAG: serine--tRNA ligase [Pseudomonadota bacterium]